MSAKDYIPSMLIGALLALVAFIILVSARSFEILALVLLLVSIILSILFARKKGIKRGTKFILTASLITFFTSYSLSFLIFGFALMAEQHNIIEVGKIENGTDCIYISEEEMERFPTLKKAIEIADREGKAKLRISSKELNAIWDKTHGKCIVYRGQFYGMSVMMV